MLWKYKKIYQDVSEEVPELTSCYNLIRASFTQMATPETEVYNLKYKLCSDSSILHIDLTEGIIYSIGDCVILNSIKIENSISVNITASQVVDAILTNSGEITIPITDNSVSPEILLGEFSFVFEECI